MMSVRDLEETENPKAINLRYHDESWQARTLFVQQGFQAGIPRLTCRAFSERASRGGSV